MRVFNIWYAPSPQSPKDPFFVQKLEITSIHSIASFHIYIYLFIYVFMYLNMTNIGNRCPIHITCVSLALLFPI